MHMKKFITPEKNIDLIQTHEFQKKNLPTLWLLGKTGAGKSSIIHLITGKSSIEIGNGFQPCTLSSAVYSFPDEKPIMRFLDTRGLSEASYDPTDDIQEALRASHALILVMKMDDPEQSAVLNILKKIKKTKIRHLLLVHTEVLSHKENDRVRLIQYQYQQVQKIWGNNFTNIDIDIQQDENKFYHKNELINALSHLLPVVGIMLEKKEHADIESHYFSQLEKEVLWYAGSAAACDLLPVIGLVSVPAVQTKMLHNLAHQYAIDWNKSTFSELIAAMGSSFIMQYSIRLGVRQLTKLIPVYGQTIGAAAAAAMSFGSTYALGRAACYYFYKKNKGEIISTENLQNLYENALKKGQKISGYEEK